MNERKFDLEERLIQFALLILDIAEKLPNTYIGNYFGKQLVRSGTSPAFHYSEAQGAESRKDFVHKLKIALKELRESSTNMKIIKMRPILQSDQLDKAIKECNELISILVKSIQTTKKNMGIK
ncbi:four helix bundle protein [Gracilimonas sp. Q87]|uniref:four helix bundle protein n=1 Tax=Gracilimonas sp. Q87 TaxID=3384766 RepID=UPI0039840260